jgi:tRNA dimethylallyltransferase
MAHEPRAKRQPRAKRPGAILIAGPTASGKSACALGLAERLGGVVINADSMQVYRELRIITARPSTDDEARVPHALYGFVPVAEAYSAGRFLEDARRAMAAARKAGRVPILVGGTGLYFKALLEGLAPIPAIPAAVRAHWRKEAARLGAGSLHAVLAERDPEGAALLRPTDAQRVVRALEVLEATGRPLRDWQRTPGIPVIEAEDTTRLVLTRERDDLYARAEARVESMIAQGALDEVRNLRDLGLAPDLPGMRATGVGSLLACLAGLLSEAEAVEAVKRETRNYIKRQLTWMRSNMIAWTPVGAQEMESTSPTGFPFIDH